MRESLRYRRRSSDMRQGTDVVQDYHFWNHGRSCGSSSLAWLLEEFVSFGDKKCDLHWGFRLDERRRRRSARWVYPFELRSERAQHIRSRGVRLLGRRQQLHDFELSNSRSGGVLRNQRVRCESPCIWVSILPWYWGWWGCSGNPRREWVGNRTCWQVGVVSGDWNWV